MLLQLGLRSRPQISDTIVNKAQKLQHKQIPDYSVNIICLDKIELNGKSQIITAAIYDPFKPSNTNGFPAAPVSPHYIRLQNQYCLYSVLFREKRSTVIYKFDQTRLFRTHAIKNITILQLLRILRANNIGYGSRKL